MTDTPAASAGAAYIVAFSAFISSLDVNVMISVGSFLLAVIAFYFNWRLRKGELEIKRQRLAFDIKKANKNTQ